MKIDLNLEDILKIRSYSKIETEYLKTLFRICDNEDVLIESLKNLFLMDEIKNEEKNECIKIVKIKDVYNYYKKFICSYFNFIVSMIDENFYIFDDYVLNKFIRPIQWLYEEFELNEVSESFYDVVFDKIIDPYVYKFFADDLYNLIYTKESRFQFIIIIYLAKGLAYQAYIDKYDFAIDLCKLEANNYKKIFTRDVIKDFAIKETEHFKKISFRIAEARKRIPRHIDVVILKAFKKIIKDHNDSIKKSIVKKYKLNGNITSENIDKLMEYIFYRMMKGGINLKWKTDYQN